MAGRRLHGRMAEVIITLKAGWMFSNVGRWLNRLRQNHALEHATLHVLSQRFLNIQLMGRSDFWGFTVVGHVSNEDLEDAAIEGLARLQAGEAQLAIHPRCGTNLATGALLSGLFASVAVGNKPRPTWEKLPRLVLAAMGALFIAQPLGLLAQQRVTTTPDVGSLHLESVERTSTSRMPTHRVKTSQA